MASAKWSSPTVCWAPTNSQRGFAGSSAVRITSTYPFPGRSPDRALDGEGIQAWLEWEWEAMRWCVPVEISKEDLEALVARSTVVLEREKHRLIHQDDWHRWGSRGGKETLRRYGPRWFSLLARRRWGRISLEELETSRVPQ